MVGGSILTAVLVLGNIPGNPILELRHHRVAGMALGHTGMVLLAIGLAPSLWRAVAVAAAMRAGRLTAIMVVGILGVATAMVALAVASPTYAHQLLTREWGLVEPMQFALYLVAARLCFAMAKGSAARLASVRLCRVGGWVFRLFALEEIDYLGVPSSLARLAGVEGSRVRGAYVGAAHDMLNVAAQYGVIWVPLLAIAVAALVAMWWVSGGRAATLWAMLSWRLLPAVGAVGLMGLAQAKDIHDAYLARWTRSPLIDNLLEEPVELLGILALNMTLVLELVRLERRASLTVGLPADYSATRA